MDLTWGQLGRKLYKSAKLNQIPISGQFELTARCNLSCKMCYVSKSNNDNDAIHRELSSSEWISLAYAARDAGMLYLLLTGGEVFIRKDFMEIYSEIAKMGFHTEIYTNATMITPSIAKALGQIPPSKVGVTIYGASDSTYQKVCGNGKAYDLTMRGIDLLVSEGITVWLKSAIIKENVGDFERIAEYAQKRGLNYGTVSYISPRREGCGTYPEAERLSPLELINFRKDANSYFSKKMEQNLVTEDMCAIEEDKVNEIETKEILQNSNDPFDCIAGKCGFWVTWDGRMTPCALMDAPYSLPFKSGFKYAWDEIKKLCLTIPVCMECQGCVHKEECMPCPARLKLETGFYNKPAPYLCEQYKVSSLTEG